MRYTVFLCLVGFGCGSPEPCESTSPFFPDADNDGWGDSRVVELACEAPAGFVVTPGDCNDDDPEQHPNADDTCDGRDDNCDGVVDEEATVSTWYLDQDGDGWGTTGGIDACEAPPGFVAQTGDCNDLDDTVFPEAEELCDGVSQSCGTSTLDESDLDGDGVRVCAGDCEDGDPTVWPGAEELCDGLDNDCDGSPDAAEVDVDVDGIFACAGDCNDDDGSVFPGAPETEADGTDQDCDGLELCYVDGDGDGVGGSTTVLTPDVTCTDPSLSSQTGDCDDGEPLRAPTLTETPYDGLDNDCNATTSDDDLDGDGWLAAEDCDDNLATVNPGMIPAVSFTDVTVDAGLWQSPWDPVLNPPLCSYEPMASGASIGDIDGDGFDDLFVASLYQPDQLYLNRGDGTFVDEAAIRGIDHAGSSNASVFADFDGDGSLDLYVSSMGLETNRLYINDGTGLFTEEAVMRGVDMPLANGTVCSFNWGVSAADVDGDGDLDLLVTQWTVSVSTDGDRNHLWINDGTGYFTDGTLAAGLDLSTRSGFSPTFGDIDADGDMDLALAADWGESGLWLNDGSGAFTETLTAGVGLDENGMGSDLGDIDGDGDLDWLVTAIYDDRDPCPSAWGCSGNVLYINDGTGQSQMGPTQPVFVMVRGAGVPPCLTMTMTATSTLATPTASPQIRTSPKTGSGSSKTTARARSATRLARLASTFPVRGAPSCPSTSTTMATSTSLPPRPGSPHACSATRAPQTRPGCKYGSPSQETPSAWALQSR